MLVCFHGVEWVFFVIGLCFVLGCFFIFGGVWFDFTQKRILYLESFDVIFCGLCFCFVLFFLY